MARGAFEGLAEDVELAPDMRSNLVGSRRLGARTVFITPEIGSRTCFVVARSALDTCFGCLAAGGATGVGAGACEAFRCTLGAGGARAACFARRCSLRAAFRALTEKRRGFFAYLDLSGPSSIPSSSRSAAGSRVVLRARSRPPPIVAAKKNGWRR